MEITDIMMYMNITSSFSPVWWSFHVVLSAISICMGSQGIKQACLVVAETVVYTDHT